jgi:hypothetical protein
MQGLSQSRLDAASQFQNATCIGDVHWRAVIQCRAGGSLGTLRCWTGGI